MNDKTKAFLFQNGVIVKFMATFIIVAITLCALFIACVYLVAYRIPPPAIVSQALGLIFALACTILGYHLGNISTIFPSLSQSQSKGDTTTNG